MALICLQAGHQGVTSGATGAPGEQELTVRIRNRLSIILQSKGFQVQLVNANPPQAEINKDFSLFIALHGDADYAGDNGSGFVDYPDPDLDGNNAESKRIKEAIESQYFSNSGITNKSRSNANTKRYYMWARLTAKTPCVILEMGQVQDAHDRVILADTDRVANAIARGICKAFNVPFDPPTPPVPPVDPCITQNRQIVDYKSQIVVLNERIINLTDTVRSLMDKISKAKENLS